MRLDVALVRYLSSDEYRILVGIEMGMRNHEIVPKELISKIAKVWGGEVYKILSDLSSARLVTRINEQKVEGYKLTVSGYDYLSLYTLSKQEVIHGVGSKIGVGKESDVYLVSDKEGNNMVLKLHRLGRTSFRNVKEKRDYLGNRLASSWLYLSRLSALREYSFMKILFEDGFPVPEPIGQNRHAVVMSLVNGTLLQYIRDLDDPRELYDRLINLLLHIAESGLIHGDYNEFNIMIDENVQPILIDFPQMVSIDHKNADMYFDRDVNCIKTFFRKKFKMIIDEEGPKLCDVSRNNIYLDIRTRASGYKKVSRKKLADLMKNNSKEISLDINSSVSDTSDGPDYEHIERRKLNASNVKRLEDMFCELTVKDSLKTALKSDNMNIPTAIPVNDKLGGDISRHIKKDFKSYIYTKYDKRRKIKANILKTQSAVSARDEIRNYNKDAWG